ncbi:MAG: carboxypeptidase regulatory-like domain-containing protein, partial [Bacteroidota bacterium]
AVRLKGIQPNVWFEYGQILMLNRKYKAALPWFEKYQKKVPDDPRAEEMIESCKNYENFKQGAGLYKIRKLKVNSDASDFGPVFYNNQVVFASARKRSLTKYNRTGQGYLDLYKADYAGETKLGEPELFRGRINTPYHEATAAFSKDGKEMFFTRNNYIKGKMGQSKEGIVNLATFRSVLEDGKWSRETPLPFNSEEYSVGHPCLSPDDKKLYFVSNMPGGYGGTDLYYVTRDGDAWGEPVNLGPAVNTKGNEMFPSMSSDGQLHFASNGHAGLGGLDVYHAIANDDSFVVVKNVGAPINSQSDDFGLIYDPAKNVGFFTSNRPGGAGDDDLYAFFKLVPLLGVVQDESGNPIADVTVTILAGRGASRVGTDEDGQFMYGLSLGRDYRLFFNKVGYEEVEKAISTKGAVADEAQIPQVIMKKAAAEEKDEK